MKKDWKINVPKYHKKRSKLIGKSRFGGTKIEVRRGPGGVWDGSWAVLSVWIAFLVFVVGLGCVLWAKRRQLGPNLGPKMEPKSNKNRCQNAYKKSMRLGPPFLVYFVGFWDGKRGQVATKMGPEIDIAVKAKNPKII